MNTKIVYKVETVVEKSDPENVSEFQTIEEAQKEFDSRKFDMQYDILYALRLKDKSQQRYLSDRTVELNKETITFDDDGQEDDYDCVTIMRYGETSDWDALREKL